MSLVIGSAFAAAALAACGSSSHSSSSPSSSHAAPPSGPPASRTGLQAKVLMPGELRGFDVAEPISATNPRAWAAVDQFPAGQRSATAARLRRLGFTGGARENLVWSAQNASGSTSPPPAALSVVEQFHSSAGARTELIGELPTLGPGTAIRVNGVPGARGYSSTGGGRDFANVLFTSGSDLYLVGAEWPNSPKQKMSVRELVAAVQRQYQRTHH